MPSVPENARGDWYVEPDCCLLCGVPFDVAPGLFAWANDRSTGKPTHCFVRKQPADAAELDQMVEVTSVSDLGCIRYRGRDPHVLALIRAHGDTAAIDPDER